MKEVCPLTPGVLRRYITRAQFEAIRLFGPTPEEYTVEYYIVPDDDPRVGGEALRTEQSA